MTNQGMEREPGYPIDPGDAWSITVTETYNYTGPFPFSQIVFATFPRSHRPTDTTSGHTSNPTPPRALPTVRVTRRQTFTGVTPATVNERVMPDPLLLVERAHRRIGALGSRLSG